MPLGVGTVMALYDGHGGKCYPRVTPGPVSPINVHVLTLNLTVCFFSCSRTSQEYFGSKAKREDAAGPSLVVLNRKVIFASTIRHARVSEMFLIIMSG